jgi:hypothetical protein
MRSIDTVNPVHLHFVGRFFPTAFNCQTDHASMSRFSFPLSPQSLTFFAFFQLLVRELIYSPRFAHVTTYGK